METTTLQERAGEAYDCFETRQRDDGESFVTLKEDSPSWVRELVCEAHDQGEWLPDDYRYRWTMEACELIASGEDYGADDLTTDIYTADLLAWVGSNLRRPGIVDEAVETFGHSDMGMVGDLMAGQLEEMRAVFSSVWASLGGDDS